MINIFLYDEYSNKHKDTFVYIFNLKKCQYGECVRKCKGVVVSPDLPFFSTLLEVLNI